MHVYSVCTRARTHLRKPHVQVQSKPSLGRILRRALLLNCVHKITCTLHTVRPRYIRQPVLVHMHRRRYLRPQELRNRHDLQQRYRVPEGRHTLHIEYALVCPVKVTTGLGPRNLSLKFSLRLFF